MLDCVTLPSARLSPSVFVAVGSHCGRIVQRSDDQRQSWCKQVKRPAVPSKRMNGGDERKRILVRRAVSKALVVPLSRMCLKMKSGSKARDEDLQLPGIASVTTAPIDLQETASQIYPIPQYVILSPR